MTAAGWQATAAIAQALAAVGQLIAAVILVKLTAKYVTETARLSEQAAQQAAAAKEVARAQQEPRIIIIPGGYSHSSDAFSGEILIRNTGVGTAYNLRLESEIIEGSPLVFGRQALAPGPEERWPFRFDERKLGDPLQGNPWDKAPITLTYEDSEGRIYVSELRDGKPRYLREQTT